MGDQIKSPDHYAGGQIECKDALKSMFDCASRMSPMEAYWYGCALKYLWRWTNKGGINDLLKCKQCIDYLIQERDAESDEQETKREY